MRITFILNVAEQNGGNRVVVEHAEALQRMGHDVLVVSRPHPTPTWKDYARAILKGRSMPQGKRVRPSHLDGSPAAHRVIDSRRPIVAADVPDADVVVATWWETAEWVNALPASKGRKFHFLQHYEAVIPSQPKQRIDAVWRLPTRKIAVSQWLVDLATQQFGQTDVTLVANAVDTKQFYGDPREKQPTPTVGLMYAATEFKGTDIAIEAYKRAAEKVKNLRLIAFGSLPVSEELPLPAGATFHQRPTTEQIRQIYSNCDAWLFASRCEGFGLPILEAMACRTPVIGTPAGAAPELLDEARGGGGGTLVPMDNPRAMADAIVRVVSLSPPDWRQMSDKARATASRYTWGPQSAKFEAALRGAG